MTEAVSILLFSYGTLQQDEVQLSSFGRLLDGEEDTMTGHTTSMVEITAPEVLRASGKRFHPVVIPSANPSDEVAGKVFRITEAELRAADAYEVSDYKRVEVILRSGRSVWVYVQA